jgi:hypothetical protein
LHKTPQFEGRHLPCLQEGVEIRHAVETARAEIALTGKSASTRRMVGVANTQLAYVIAETLAALADKHPMQRPERHVPDFPEVFYADRFRVPPMDCGEDMIQLWK